MKDLELTKSKKISFHVKNRTAEPGKISCLSAQDEEPISLLNELMKVCKIENEDVLLEMLGAATSGMPTKNDLALTLNVTAQVLAENRPEDLHESSLCLQANNLFLQGMHYLGQANRSDPPIAEFYLNSSIKLLRLHNETLQTLYRYRRKAEQTVIVQHVNVHGGGQAIVGSVKTGGVLKNGEPHG